MPQPPFNLDTYEYAKGPYYPAFKKDTDEKICAEMVSSIVADSLREEGLVYKDPAVSIPVADIGCGPADSIQMYLGGARHKGGFDLHVTDFSEDYAGPRGKAHENLTIAKSAGKIRLNSFSVKKGDAFNGKLHETLEMGEKTNHFPLAFISHMFYHTEPKHLKTMLDDVSSNLLTKDGVGILFHIENKPNNFQHFRYTFGNKSRKEDASDTPGFAIKNPPAEIEEACKDLGIPCETVTYTNHYYLGPMNAKYWEMFKHPEQYKDIDSKEALANLNKLYFIVQRGANAFAADKSDHGLETFIDEVRKVIAPDPEKFEKEGGFMPLAETVQLIGSNKADEHTAASLKQVHDKIQKKVPELEKNAFHKWQKRWASMDRAA